MWSSSPISRNVPVAVTVDPVDGIGTFLQRFESALKSKLVTMFSTYSVGDKRVVLSKKLTGH